MSVIGLMAFMFNVACSYSNYHNSVQVFSIIDILYYLPYQSHARDISLWAIQYKQMKQLVL